jgi:glycine/serine hydroxymethyltransferase
MKDLEKITEILNKYTEPQDMDYYLHGCIMNEQLEDLAKELAERL